MRNKKSMLANWIGLFIVILIGTSLIPLVSKQIDLSTKENNSTGVLQFSSTLIQLIPVLFGLVIMIAGANVVYSVWKHYCDEEEPEEVKEEIQEEKPKGEPKHEQTYLEYVKERKTIERMMGT